MRKLSPFIVLLLASIVLLYACKKNNVEEIYTPVVTPVIPDFTTLVTAGVTGFITDENGNAVEGVTVKGGQVTVTTNRFGYFKIAAADFAKSAGFVQVNKAGYFTAYRSFSPVAGKTNFVRLQLIPKINAGTIDAATGGTVTVTDGATISLPAAAVVVAANNTAYNGSINVAIHWLDPSGMQTTQATMPGDLRGVDSTGHLKALVTYGMLAVELTGSGGEHLQIAAGKTVTLHFPLPAAIAGAAPPTIPLWYFDETNGLWKQDGYAVKNGSGYDGTVSHFTFWNCDVGLDLIDFSLQVTDMALQPLANTAVSITITGQPASTRISYTNANGEVTGMIPANADLTIEIVSTCAQSVTVRTLQTGNGAVDLGTVEIDMQQSAATIRGTVNNCSGLPVASGVVVLETGGVYSSVDIVNGIFNAATMRCANALTTIIAIDNETALQSTIQSVTLATGTNEIGTLSTCVTGEYFTYAIDGASTTLTAPLYQFDGKFYVADNNSNLVVTNISNIQIFNIELNGLDAVGDHIFLPNVINYTTESGVYIPYEAVTPTAVTITEYGQVGQFIKGSYEGTVRSGVDNSIHTLSFTFNIKRDQ